MREAGLDAVEWRTFAGGIVALHTGVAMSRRLDGGDQGAEVPALPAPERV
jgi:hypothetical protein